MRILITGSTGFIGRNVVDYLVLQNKCPQSLQLFMDRQKEIHF